MVEQRDGGELIGLMSVILFFASIILVTLFATVSKTVRTVKTARLNSELVENLANRGFAPGEIRDIIVASRAGRIHLNPAVPSEMNGAKPVSVPSQKPIRT